MSYTRLLGEIGARLQHFSNASSIRTGPRVAHNTHGAHARQNPPPGDGTDVSGVGPLRPSSAWALPRLAVARESVQAEHDFPVQLRALSTFPFAGVEPYKLRTPRPTPTSQARATIARA